MPHRVNLQHHSTGLPCPLIRVSPVLFFFASRIPTVCLFQVLLSFVRGWVLTFHPRFSNCSGNLRVFVAEYTSAIRILMQNNYV